MVDAKCKATINYGQIKKKHTMKLNLVLNIAPLSLRILRVIQNRTRWRAQRTKSSPKCD